MEGFGILLPIILYVGWFIIRAMLNSEHDVEGYGGAQLGPPQLDIWDDVDEQSGIAIKKIMFTGALNNPRAMELAFAISALDSTDGDGNWRSLISFSDQACEPETVCYQMRGNFGWVDADVGLMDWTQLGIIVPEFVQPPVKGVREITLLLRIFNAMDPPDILGGKSAEGVGETVLSQVITFTHEFTEPGYEEEKADRELAQSISLQVGIAVAMADGSLDDEEGEVLRNWIIRETSFYHGEEQDRLKEFYNGALRDGFNAAESGTLDMDQLIERLAQINNKKAKYEAIELSLNIMAADGVADPEEMKLIRDVANRLGLDMNEVEQMREGVTLNLSGALDSSSNVEALVGIDESWDEDKKRKHLRQEFQKWSNRLNSLPEGAERESAQSMLDNIAELRKKYG